MGIIGFGFMRHEHAKMMGTFILKWVEAVRKSSKTNKAVTLKE